MLNRSTLGRAGTTIVTVALLAALAAVVRGQAAPPKKPADTTKKAAPAVTHLKITKDTLPGARAAKREMQSSGDVCLALTCTIGQDSVDRAVAAVRAQMDAREQWARNAQRQLDSMQAADRTRAALNRLRMRIANEREQRWRDSVMRAEAAEREAQAAMRKHLARGWYVGVAAGASTPLRDTRNGYTGGWNTTIPVGWDANDSPLGFRADLGVDHLNGSRLQDQYATTTAASGDITVWSLNTDVKLRAHAPGTPTRTNVYALGGAGVHRVTQGVYGTTGPDAGRTLSFENAKTAFGFNVGAGVSFSWGSADLFVESRFVQVKTDMPYHMNNGVGTYTSFTPVVVGIQWF